MKSFAPASRRKLIAEKNPPREVSLLCAARSHSIQIFYFLWNYLFCQQQLLGRRYLDAPEHSHWRLQHRQCPDIRCDRCSPCDHGIRIVGLPRYSMIDGPRQHVRSARVRKALRALLACSEQALPALIRRFVASPLFSIKISFIGAQFLLILMPLPPAEHGGRARRESAAKPCGRAVARPSRRRAAVLTRVTRQKGGLSHSVQT